MAAAVFGVLLAIGTLAVVGAVLFSDDHSGALWIFLLVPLVGVGMVRIVRGREGDPRAVSRAQLAVIAGSVFFGTCVAVVLWALAGYEGN